MGASVNAPTMQSYCLYIIKNSFIRCQQCSTYFERWTNIERGSILEEEKLCQRVSQGATKWTRERKDRSRRVDVKRYSAAGPLLEHFFPFLRTTPLRTIVARLSDMTHSGRAAWRGCATTACSFAGISSAGWHASCIDAGATSSSPSLLKL